MDEPTATLAAEINEAHAAARRATLSALEHARRCGELLIEAKGRLPHGEWLSWLEMHTAVSERTSQLYIRLAKRWGELQAKTQRVADLPLRDALALLAEPEQVARADEDHPTVDASPFLPLDGCALAGKFGDDLVLIEPSDREGFYFLTVMLPDGDGEPYGVVEGFKPPVAAAWIGEVLAAIYPRFQAMRWQSTDAEPAHTHPWLDA